MQNLLKSMWRHRKETRYILYRSLALVHSKLVWGKSKCTEHIALSIQPINQFEVDQQTRKQALKAYCPVIYYQCNLFVLHFCFWQSCERLVHFLSLVVDYQVILTPRTQTYSPWKSVFSKKKYILQSPLSLICIYITVKYLGV